MVSVEQLLLLDCIRRLAVLATFIAAGVSDYRTRTIDNRIWLVGSLAAAPPLLYLYTKGFYAPVPHLLSLALALLLARRLWRARLAGRPIGEADPVAWVFLGLFEPPIRIAPLCFRGIIMVIIFGLPVPAVMSIVVFVLMPLCMLWDAAKNVRGGALETLKGQSLRAKISALLRMRYVTREEFLTKQHMYIPPSERGEPLPGKLENLPPRFWAKVLLPYVTLLAAGLLIYNLLLLYFCGI